MRFARIILGLLFVLLGVAVAVGEFLMLHGNEPVQRIETLLSFMMSLCSLVSAAYFFCPSTFWESRLVCPSCHRRGSMHPSQWHQRGISIVVWVFTGLIGALLYSNARKRSFRCESCEASSRVRTVGGWLAILWILLVIVACLMAPFLH